MQKTHELLFYAQDSDYPIKCGAIFKKGNGKNVIKLDVLPVNGFEGWLNVSAYTPRPKNEIT